MKILKRFTSDQEAQRCGYRKVQIIPPHLEKQFPDAPYWLRFKHQGKQYWIKLEGAQNRREAEKLAKNEYARVVHVDARYKHLQGEMPFPELVDRYLAERRYKPSYLWTELRCKRLVEFFGDKPIGKIQREDIISLRDQLKSEITKRGTQRTNADVNHFLKALRASLNFAVQNEWLAVSPFKHGITLREQEHPIRYFTDQEMHRILDACVGPIAHVRPMIEFCLLTDCRTAEMLCLRWEDVDFEGSRIHFRNTKTAVDRFVKMGLELRRLLYNLPRFEGCEWVFPSPRILRPYGHTSKKYQRFLPQFPRKVWNTIRKRAMLTDKAAVPYGFRRTSATILAKNLGLHEAQEILGHSDIATTRRYAAVVADTYDRAAEVLEERVSRAVNGGRQ